MESWEIAGHTLEFEEEEHQYICDGICIPSITQILKLKFNKKYDGISSSVLYQAAEMGTKIHNKIEEYEKLCIDDENCQELKNYKFLKKQYKFKCLDNEVPIILFKNKKPIAGGRLDLFIEIDNELGLADIKRTATLDKEYLGYQLNLYRIGFQQCYGKKIDFLKGIHLKDGKRKFVDIPINENLVNDLIDKYMEKI